MSYYFSIIGTRDNPLYEVEFSSFKAPSGPSNSLPASLTTNSATTTATNVPGRAQFPPNVREILPFVLNSSLDLIEDAQWSTSLYYLGKIDSFYGLNVSAFITQGNIKLVLCYDLSSTAKHDDNAIRQFFIEVNELYVKCLLNPFYLVNDAIVSPDFDLKVKMLGRKYL